MAFRKGSFGMVALIVTMAIVLLLVAKRWQLLSSARQAAPFNEASIPSEGLARAADPALGLSGLQEAEALTSAHAKEVGSALEATQD